jgi:chromosome partitioning protein
MPVISIMTTKGGAGKPLLRFSGTGLAEQGADVCLIDADPNQPLVRWAEEANLPSNLSVVEA